MTNAKWIDDKCDDVAPVLREVFPDLSQEELQELDDCFVALFGVLHRYWMRDQMALRDTKQLDDSVQCDSVNITV